MTLKKGVMRFVTILMACCLALCNVGAFASSANVSTELDVARTYNFSAGYTLMTPWNGNMQIEVYTEAFEPANHIWHDITIYKNGVWYSSETFENWNSRTLQTIYNIPSQPGDIYQVYVDHHVDWESKSSQTTGMYQ